MPRELNISFFPGFYESWLSQIVDYEESSFCENESEGWPEELRLESLFEAIDYSAAYEYLTGAYVEALQEAAGFSIKFSDMTSPKYYNFETDRLFVMVSDWRIKRMFAASRKEDHASLAKVFRTRFTSRSGFISHYSPDLPEKPLADWDCNELGALFDATCDSDLEETVRDLLSGDSEVGYRAFESAVDWTKVDAMRCGKLLEWLESDPESARLWIGNHPDQFDSIRGENPGFDMLEHEGTIPYRCQKTPDLFQGV